MVKEKTQSKIRPNKFTCNKLGKKLEISLNENIVETVNSENETFFVYDSTFKTVPLGTRSDIIESYIALKYSIGNEIALLNKAKLDAENVDYLEYRQFVEEVKDFVDGVVL